MQFGVLVFFTALVSPGFAAPMLDDCGNFFKKVLRIATKVDIQDFEHLMKFDLS